MAALEQAFSASILRPRISSPSAYTGQLGEERQNGECDAASRNFLVRVENVATAHQT